MTNQDVAPGIILAERGRKQPQYSSSTEAFFEIVALPPGSVSQIEVYALNHAGTIIGSGTERHYPRFHFGQVFGVTLFNTRAGDIAGWLAQAPSAGTHGLRSLGDALGLHEASAPHNLASIGEPKHRPFPIKGGYGGEVHVHKRTRVFHHPRCSSAKAMDDRNRVVLNSPDDAQQQRYVPCYACMLGFGNP